MKAINDYYVRQLTAEEIAAGEHRKFVGGLWEEIGALQFEFLRQHGLRPDHSLLDVGCGALRCGLPIIEYLEPGNYCGVDLNASLIEAGRYELAQKNLSTKNPQLLVSDKFELDSFGRSFDFIIAQSLFTHLNSSLIVRCLTEVANVLKPNGNCYATFFIAPAPAHLGQITHQPGGVVTNFDSDPFHYAFEEISRCARESGLSAELLGDWGHPRAQQMVRFSLSPKSFNRKL